MSWSRNWPHAQPHCEMSFSEKRFWPDVVEDAVADVSRRRAGDHRADPVTVVRGGGSQVLRSGLSPGRVTAGCSRFRRAFEPQTGSLAPDPATTGGEQEGGNHRHRELAAFEPPSGGKVRRTHRVSRNAVRTRLLTDRQEGCRSRSWGERHPLQTQPLRRWTKARPMPVAGGSQSAREALPSAGLEGRRVWNRSSSRSRSAPSSSSSTASSPVARGSHCRPALAAAGPGRAAAGRSRCAQDVQRGTFRASHAEGGEAPTSPIGRTPHRSHPPPAAAFWLVFAVLVASAADLLSGPDELTFSTTPVPRAAAPPAESVVGRRARGDESESEALRAANETTGKSARRGRGSVNAKAGPAAVSSPKRVRTRRRRSALAPKARRRRPGRARRRSACSAGVAAQPPSTTSSISSGARRPSTRHAQ